MAIRACDRAPTRVRWVHAALLLLGGGTLAAAEPAMTSGSQLEVAWHFLYQGGLTLAAIGVLSIAMVAIAIERWSRLGRPAIVPDGLADECRALWQADDHDGIIARCSASASVLGHAIIPLVRYRPAGLERAAGIAAETASAGVKPHLRAAKPLLVIANIAPLLGLFGTIIGMIRAFYQFQLLGESGTPGVFAGSIAQALVTTAGGLLVAAPALALYHYFKARAIALGDDLEGELNRLATEWFLDAAPSAASPQRAAESEPEPAPASSDEREA